MVARQLGGIFQDPARVFSLSRCPSYRANHRQGWIQTRRLLAYLISTPSLLSALTPAATPPDFLIRVRLDVRRQGPSGLWCHVRAAPVDPGRTGREVFELEKRLGVINAASAA